MLLVGPIMRTCFERFADRHDGFFLSEIVIAIGRL